MPTDDDLLSRLNALRQSSISLSKDPTFPSIQPASSSSSPSIIPISRSNELSTSNPSIDTATSLSARLKAIRHGAISPSPPSSSPHSHPQPFPTPSTQAVTRRTSDPTVRDLEDRLRHIRNQPAVVRKRERERVPQAVGAEGEVPEEDIEIEMARGVKNGYGDGERSLKELVRELGMEGEEWIVKEGERRELGELVKEARGLVGEEVGSEERDGVIGGSGDVGEGEEKDEMAEEEEADEYVAKVLAELKYARKYGGDEDEGGNDDNSDDGHDREDSAVKEENDHNLFTTKDKDTKEQDAPATHAKGTEAQDAPKDTSTEEANPFDLPSAPNAALEEPSSLDTNLSARLNALAFPSAPNFALNNKKTLTSEAQSKEFTDEEIDNWCIMCNDDGAVKCRGCDDDVYCRTCWAEGHTGPEAGYEERRHKVVAFRRAR